MGELFCTRCEQLLGTDSVKEVKAALHSSKLLFARKVVNCGMLSNIESLFPMPHDSEG
jgi:hypothetical protein